MSIPTIGMPMGANIDLTHAAPGIIPDSDKWFGVASSTWWDGLTSFSVIVSYDSTIHLLSGDSLGIFSAYYKDGSNNYHGFSIWQYYDVIYMLFGDGGGTMPTQNNVAFNGYRFSMPYGAGKGTSPRIHVCASWDSAGSGSSTLAVYNQGKVLSGVLQPARVSNVKTTGRTTALGNIGTNTEIRVGNLFDGTTTSAPMRSWYKIKGAKFWKNEALSLSDFDSIVGYTSGVEDKQVRSAKRIEKLGYGGSTGITLPERDWRVQEISSANKTLGFRDEGTEASKLHMVAANNAKISVYGKY